MAGKLDNVGVKVDQLKLTVVDEHHVYIKHIYIQFFFLRLEIIFPQAHTIGFIKFGQKTHIRLSMPLPVAIAKS